MRDKDKLEAIYHRLCVTASGVGVDPSRLILWAELICPPPHPSGSVSFKDCGVVLVPLAAVVKDQGISHRKPLSYFDKRGVRIEA